MTNYQLNKIQAKKRISLSNFWPLIKPEWKFMTLVFVIILLNAAVNVALPYFLGVAVDHAIKGANEALLMQIVMWLIGLFIAGLITNYLQISLMGRMSQRLLFGLRNNLFNKIQELPLNFFNSNKIGDLISRINNDTDKINGFFSEGLVRFVGTFFTILGIAIFMFVLDVNLALVSLSVCAFLILFTQFLSPWLKHRNEQSLKSLGQFSGEIQEDLNNFKAIVAFNQGQYFYNKFEKFNQDYFQAARKAAFANAFLTPIYDLAGYMANIMMLLVGLVIAGHQLISIGLLVTFLAYTERFYQPLRILGAIWANIQVSLAAWSRIDQILHLKSDLKVEESNSKANPDLLLEFRDVSFAYTEDHNVLNKINLRLEYGKTYALIGPTGGGKSTTASLMARLYDVTDGEVFFDGKALKAYQPHEITEKIGFVLQEPIVFSGTVLDNILYGNKKLESFQEEDVVKVLKDKGLMKILDRFPEGLQTKISPQAESISLGQRQLIAFLRIFLREPILLILDEATANIDTITEQYLSEIVDNLPATTTKVIIAHRLNTIKDADEIIFISGGATEKAVGFEEALQMIEKNKLSS